MPRRTRRRALVVVIILAVVVAAGVVTTVVLTSGHGSSPWQTGAQGLSTAPTPTSATAPHDSGAGGTSNARPLPPPTPTGKPYEDQDPQVGDCADLARRPTGVAIYQADCADPAATLILDDVQDTNGKCPGKGFFGLDSLSKTLLCFTYTFKQGDCVDMKIPRRISCEPQAIPVGDDAPAKVTVTEIQHGQHDGSGCPQPDLFLQVGKGAERGIACIVSATKSTTAAPPSR